MRQNQCRINTNYKLGLHPLREENDVCFCQRMSAIEIQRIRIMIEEVRERISAVEAAAGERMNGIQGGVDDLGAQLQALRASVDAVTGRLEEHLSLSLKAHIDATLDVMKNELRAYIRSLVPYGPAH